MLVEHSLINGRYEILREVGSGGSGCVYAATDRTTDKRVAVKIFGHQVHLDRSAREKFELEARVAGRVESENIVQVSDAGLDPTTQLPYLVMEFLKGSNLQELVQNEGKLRPALAVEYLTQVASGLDKAHSWHDRDGRHAPIVHRDLKPSNLFLAHHENGAPLMKILDWGIAKVISTSATLSGDLRGTPLYMAPEQLLQEPVTPATDIWAFGLIAFYLLTGHCYWKSSQRPNVVWPALIKEVCEGPQVLPQVRFQELDVAVELPPAFDDWFMRCVNLDPSVRFSAASEAVHALAKVLNSSISELGPDSSARSSNALARLSQAGGLTKSPIPTAPITPKLWLRSLTWLAIAASFLALLLAVKFRAPLGLSAHSARELPMKSGLAREPSVSSPVLLPSSESAPSSITPSEPPLALSGTRPRSNSTQTLSHSVRTRAGKGNAANAANLQDIRGTWERENERLRKKDMSPHP